jgi:hypothetical protein
VTLVLDAGALIAIERGEARLVALIKREVTAGRPMRTHAGVVGQVWRGGGRQARLARALDSFDVRSIDDDLGRKAGVLIGRAQSADVIDAALVLIAEDGDEILTADHTDLNDLIAVSGRLVDLVEI